ncbi:hypothetical protein ACIF8T_40130 [Streptomyces sp. NPDC085946]|uniref:hypothetical protein n=1 Tax=Streptomyces sp. NPDC085946 TaxID=3365744 RepID=UPI0037CD1B6F
MEQLASRALSSGQRKVHVQRDENGRIVGAGSKDEEHDDGGGAAAKSSLPHFFTPCGPATVAAFLRTRIYRPESRVWLEEYRALGPAALAEEERDHWPARRSL